MSKQGDLVNLMIEMEHLAHQLADAIGAVYPVVFVEKTGHADSWINTLPDNVYYLLQEAKAKYHKRKKAKD